MGDPTVDPVDGEVILTLAFACRPNTKYDPASRIGNVFKFLNLTFCEFDFIFWTGYGRVAHVPACQFELCGTSDRGREANAHFQDQLSQR